MRVLGIDPGLTRLGLGVVDGRMGRASLVAVDVVRTPATKDTAERLVEIERAVQEWVERYAPEAMAIERVFAQHNRHSVMDTMQAAGVASLVGARAGLPVAYHTPSEVKAAVTGSGSADKAQVTQMITRILRMDTPPRPADAADALAIAVTHAWRGPRTNRYAAAVAAVRGRA
ncbi:crossover junction endodeoxyribonuclease RuvC [uncultured Tessaracoccus sp.]|uniref:crossover junction endodeoxyribonuclease RuvC n=1 Tax=uncultured Tessaracoccus sp. TaxID=905023 RepID=UPI0025FA9FBC|nr:crossover junction endodeoxyribonuclease RuvC [uncultured Tessaracoccus sp.]